MLKNRKIRTRMGLKAMGAGAVVLFTVASPIPAASDAAEPEQTASLYRLGFLWGLPPIAEWPPPSTKGSPS